MIDHKRRLGVVFCGALALSILLTAPLAFSIRATLSGIHHAALVLSLILQAVAATAGLLAVVRAHGSSATDHDRAQFAAPVRSARPLARASDDGGSLARICDQLEQLVTLVREIRMAAAPGGAQTGSPSPEARPRRPEMGREGSPVGSELDARRAPSPRVEEIPGCGSYPQPDPSGSPPARPLEMVVQAWVALRQAGRFEAQVLREELSSLGMEAQVTRMTENILAVRTDKGLGLAVPNPYMVPTHESIQAYFDVEPLGDRGTDIQELLRPAELDRDLVVRKGLVR